MLKLERVNAGYNGVPVLHEVSLSVAPGCFVCLIGANGAGKTTVLRAISGLLRPTAGSISFDGCELAGSRTSFIVRSGITHCPEGRRVFPFMTVFENLLVGAHILPGKRDFEAGLATVYEYFPWMRERARQPAGSLSGGEQQMLAISRALITRPKLLLLDEPSLGLSPKLATQVAAIVKSLHRSGMAILLVEQNAQLALRLADYAYVMESGRVALEGPGRQLIDDSHVREAYLGARDVQRVAQASPG